MIEKKGNCLRTLLICHRNEPLHVDVVARWLASFSALVGILVLDERASRYRQRIRREIKRIGVLRFTDVIGMRVYYKLFLSRADLEWKTRLIEEMRERFPALPVNTPITMVDSVNSLQTETFVRESAPDIIIALCKTIIRPEIFRLASTGTFVLHPGVCPEYRNAYGCFWALARRDLSRVGLTLLKIDEGIDTGPVYGYFTYPYDERRESHIRIQTRMLFENLEPISKALLEIHAGQRSQIPTVGRSSAVWGQPWLSAYLLWKWAARRELR